MIEWLWIKNREAMGLRKLHNETDGPQWIVVYITNNLQEAYILAGKLKANEIPALIHQEAGATALGITLGNLGEIKILVMPTDYERAERILFTESNEQIEASNDKMRIIWQDDGDGDEYYVEDDD
ncbi:MAG: DUF2007 domain-containing protein [Chloroflexi bacterium]|nr:DUF2007 domain-containing protein [Chloroflexota bacterium]